MAGVPPAFYINYHNQQILVSLEARKAGCDFIIHLDTGKVKLKSEGSKTKLWIEKGKGATSLAYTLGQLIENVVGNHCRR